MHGEEAIYLKKDFSRKLFIIKDNVNKKEKRRILRNGNCREKRHSVVKIIIKHIFQGLLHSNFSSKILSMISHKFGCNDFLTV